LLAAKVEGGLMRATQDRWIYSLVFFFFISLFSFQILAADCGKSGEEYACQEALVKFSKSASPAEIEKILSGANAIPLQYFDYGRIYHLKLNSDKDTLSQIQELRNQNKVLIASPNAKVTADSLPNDPYFSYMWGLQNTGQFNPSAAGVDIEIEGAWNFFTDSSSVIVAVIDTGVDYTHPDLADNMWVNAGEIPNNGIDDDANGYVDDVHGYDFYNNDGDPYDDYYHGTHVAGTIGAVGNNGIGVVGVAQKAKIMAVKFLGSNGWGYYSGAISAIQYAIANGAKVLNNSWGGFSYDSGLWSAVAASDAAGVIFVAAAGNSSVNTDYYPFYPSALSSPNIISVAAMTYNDHLAYFSNYGAYSVDLAAPGDFILSTFPAYGGEAQYGYLSGTSMATPHVSGAAALLWSAFPYLSHRQVINLLYQGVSSKSYLGGKSVTGGMLNLAKSLALEDPSLNHAPIANAGSNQYSLVGSLVTLEGSGIDEDGNALTYSWSLIGPAGSLASLDSTQLQKPSFKADLEGIYFASLQVSDWTSTSTASTVSIEVKKNPNISPPTVVIRPKKASSLEEDLLSGSVVQKGEKVILDAQGSSAGTISANEFMGLEYEWEFIEKPVISNGAIADADQAVAFFIPDAEGTYTIRLTLNDSHNENSGEISFVVLKDALDNSAGTSLPPTENIEEKPFSGGGGLGGCALQGLNIFYVNPWFVFLFLQFLVWIKMRRHTL